MTLFSVEQLEGIEAYRQGRGQSWNRRVGVSTLPCSTRVSGVTEGRTKAEISEVRVG